MSSIDHSNCMKWKTSLFVILVGFFEPVTKTHYYSKCASLYFVALHNSSLNISKSLKSDQNWGTIIKNSVGGIVSTLHVRAHKFTTLRITRSQWVFIRCRADEWIRCELIGSWRSTDYFHTKYPIYGMHSMKSLFQHCWPSTKVHKIQTDGSQRVFIVCWDFEEIKCVHICSSSSTHQFAYRVMIWIAG